MTPGKEMPRWLVLNNAGRVGSSMQRKGGEGERAHRGWCREEGRGRSGTEGEFGGLTPVVIKGMECERYI